MKISLHPAAEQDIHNAAAFYEREGSAMLAARFVAEFKQLTSLLLRHPELGAPRNNGRRALAMNVFPYTVIYRFHSAEIKVLVVKHDRKHPGFGANRS